jgi:branched-chain amino acid transport system substrate-binding protein
MSGSLRYSPIWKGRGGHATSWPRVWAAALAGAVLGAALLAGCSSSGNSTSSSGGSTSAGTTGAGASTATTGSKATKSPILIGVAVWDRGPDSNGPELDPGLAGGLYYVNDVLGGVNGHPLELDICHSDSTPAVEVNCANNFVSKGVVAVLDDHDYGIAAEDPILTRANIPIFGVEPGSAATDTSSSAYYFGPPNEAFAVGPFQIFKGLGWTKINVTSGNAAQLVEYADDVLSPVAKKLGIDLRVTYYDPSSVNWTVVASSLLVGNPQMTGILVGQESDCTSLIQALRTNGYQGPAVMGSCSSYVTQAPSAALGTYTYTGVWLPELAAEAPPAIQAQIKAYNAAMAHSGYADTNALGQWAVNSFAALVDFRHTLQLVSGSDYTAASVTAAFPKVVSYQSFMGPVDTCDHTQWPGTSSCTNQLLILKVASGDKYEPVGNGFAAIDAAILKP